MNTSEPKVTISAKKYAKMKDEILWLRCLENAGVDNWEGYDESLEYYRSISNYDDEED